MALTKYQIRNQINSYTRKRNNFSKNLTSYKSCLDCANKLVSHLENSVSRISLTQDHMSRFFTINGKMVADEELSESKEKLNNMKRELNNVIIPSINSWISSLDSNINFLDREIRKLRRQLSSM